MGLFRRDPEAGEGLARQLQASLQLGLHRLIDAEAAEVFQLPGAFSPDQEVGLRREASHPFDGKPGRKGVGDGQHDEASRNDTGGFEERDVPLGDAARAAAGVVAKTIGSALDEPFLPAAPEKGACQWCDYRPVCGPHEELRTRKKYAPPLAPLRALRELP